MIGPVIHARHGRAHDAAVDALVDNSQHIICNIHAGDVDFCVDGAAEEHAAAVRTAHTCALERVRAALGGAELVEVVDPLRAPLVKVCHGFLGVASNLLVVGMD